MTDRKPERLQKLAVTYNVGIQTIVDFLRKKGVQIDSNPNSRVPVEFLGVLDREFASPGNRAGASNKPNNKPRPKQEPASIDDSTGDQNSDTNDDQTVFVRDVSHTAQTQRTNSGPQFKVVGKVELDKLDPKKRAEVSNTTSTTEPTPPSTTPTDAVSTQEKTAFDARSTKEELKTEPQSPAIEHQSTQTETRQNTVGSIQMHQPELQQKASTLEPQNNKEESVETTSVEKNQEAEIYKSEVQKLTGPRVVGKIELPVEKKSGSAASKEREKEREKEKRNKRRRRKRIAEGTPATGENKPAQSPGTSSPAGDRDRQNRDGQRPPRTDRPQRAPGDHSPSDRPQGDRPQGDRPQRPAGPGTNAPRNDRPNQGQNRPGERRQPDRQAPATPAAKRVDRFSPDEEDVQKQVKETLARLTSKKKSTTSKHRRQKRDEIRQRHEREVQDAAELARTTLQVNEFMTVAEISQLMEVSVTDVIKTCMELGLFVSINQRLDADTISVIAETYEFVAEFQDMEEAERIEAVEDSEEDLMARPPIVTVMGHVDHGKTSLLDFVRHANVIAGEAGGITQHIGAYSVELKDGQKITFLDTPGHEAFTAMRARGAKVTDVAIIVVAADDSVMPQTVEAINHASAAGVPIVFAINKVDKNGANPDRIRQQLADMGYLVEEWGGKYQSKEISAKFGTNVLELLELVLLEAEILDLKANPNKNAIGSVVESSLDRGRGYLTTVLVQGGTLRVGDFMLAGTHTGKVKAMFNERNQRIEQVGPGEPALILGLNGAPQAGDNFHVLDSEREAKEIANRREQLRREMSLRTKRHVTLDEIGRRIAIGNFHELNVIVKGDVDGSIEALSDTLIKLSTPEIQVNVIHKAVGQISESDVMLATASDAIIVGFQVRPSINARKLAEKEKIDIRLYSVIYDAIDEIKDAMQGMLSPEIKEEIVSTLEIREVFKISKVGTIAGCIVRDGKITRNTRVRIIRDGIVVFTGELGSLKRFKDDVKEVSKGFECGLNIERFNDLKVGDIIEGFETKEVQKLL